MRDEALPRPVSHDDVVAAALATVEPLCARATRGGAVTKPVAAGEAALELRDLFPTMDDAVFDAHIAAVVRAAGHVSIAEAADACEVESYADAAWEAGLDPADAGHVNTDDELDGCAEFRSAVIEFWDLMLRAAVLRLASDERAPATDGVARSTGSAASGS